MTPAMRRFITGITALALILTLGGCMKQYSSEEVKQMLLDGLEKKYGEEFVGVSYSPEEVLKPYAEYYVRPKNGDKEGFTVQIGPVIDGKLAWIRDNYYGLLIKDDYEKVVRSLLDKEFKTYTLELEMANNTTESSVLTKDTSLDEIYDKSLAWYNAHKPKDDPHMTLFSPVINVWVKESSVEGVDVEAAVMRIMNTMAAKKLECRIFVGVEKDDSYDALPKHQKEWSKCFYTGINAEDLSVREINKQER